MASVGMMDPAYFVGKVELLNWLNELLKLNYSKVEQCNSGAAYCQIIDAVYPGEVPLKKVNFEAKHEQEFVKNFKVLQNAFDKKQISKHVDVQKLILPGSSSFIHNLEFLQWIKKYFDTHYGGHPYNAVERRGGAGAVGVKENVSAAPAAKAAAPAARAPAAAEAKPAAAARSAAPARVATKDVTNSAAAARPARPTSAKKPAAAAGMGEEETRKLQEELSSLKFTVEKLEGERDFYFGKLREVEVVCQKSDTMPPAELVETIQAILYAEEDPQPQAA